MCLVGPSHNYSILFAHSNIMSPAPMLNDAATVMCPDSGISARYKDLASSSSVGKKGAPGSECRKKSPDSTPHLGQVLAKYFSPSVFENFNSV